MARCTSCNKFCPTEVGDPDADDIEVEIDAEAAKTWTPSAGDAFVTISTTIIVPKTSECCGDDVAEARVEITAEVTDEDALTAIRDHLAKPLAEDDEHDPEIETEEVSYAEEGTGKKAKEVVTAQWTLTCCGERLAEGRISGDIDEWEVN
jgi:hypothetical protein